MHTASVAGIVLAAGRSARVRGVPGGKALARVGGEPFVVRTCRTLRDAGASEVVVVVAEPHGALVQRALPSYARAVWNEAPERGMFSSLQCGLDVISPSSRTIVALVDHPDVQVATVRALLDAPAAAVLIPAFGGRRGHPVVLSAASCRVLRGEPPTASTRDALRRVGPARVVDVRDPSVLQDLDAFSSASHADLCDNLDLGSARP